ncbi:MAG: hypothetical protein R6X33_16785 [Candidatus Brocadiia bacterium]
MLADVLIALVVAGVSTGLLAWWLGTRGPNRILGYVSAFLFLFMAVWAGGLWLRPIGPELWGTAYLGFMAAGFVFALVLAAFLSQLPSMAAEVATEGVALGMGVFFYLLNFIFLAAIVTHYTWYPVPD